MSNVLPGQILLSEFEFEKALQWVNRDFTFAPQNFGSYLESKVTESVEKPIEPESKT